MSLTRQRSGSQKPSERCFFCMPATWSVHELAIFSLESFVFGVDCRQIQEIFSVMPPTLFETDDSGDVPVSLSHYHKQLPLFVLRRCLGFSPVSPSTIHCPATCISFYQGTTLWACLVDSVENVFSVSFNLLQAVPRIIAPSAHKLHLWGFYEREGTIIPLLELENLVKITQVQSQKKRPTG